MFGYRRDEKGELVTSDPLWDPGQPEVKAAMERTRLAMFGYCRNLQGKIVATLEEAVGPTPSQRQARVVLSLAGASVSWRNSTGLWTVACNVCGQPIYQEKGSYPQEKLSDEDAAANAVREHQLACR